MVSSFAKRMVHRRKFVLGVGTAAAAVAIGARRPALNLGALAQTDGTPAAAWTPPPIPKPLPTPGGTPPAVVGAAPTAANPSATDIDNPTAGGTPAAPEGVVVDPGEPAQPAGSPAAATPVATDEAAATVKLTADFRFDPAAVRIQAGEAVMWTNAGRSPQTVTADPARADDPSSVALPDGVEPWDSGVLNAGGTYLHTFDVAGEYVYFSMPREGDGMVGRVIVEG